MAIMNEIISNNKPGYQRINQLVQISVNRSEKYDKQAKQVKITTKERIKSVKAK